MTNRTIHRELSRKPQPFWQQLAARCGYPARLAAGRYGGGGMRAYLRGTQALFLRFMRHPRRNFVVGPRATFRDLSAPALNCIQRRNATPMFLVRTGPGYDRMRSVQEARRRIVDAVAPGDLIQVLPTNSAFLVYDRGAVRDGDLVDEIGDDFRDTPPPRTPTCAGPDRMADLFPMIVRYLRSGRPWSILFNNPDGPPSRPVQMICARRSDKRRCFEIRWAYWTNMTPTFDELENYLRQKAGQSRRPCPDTQLYPLLRAAMDPDSLTESNYVYIWWSYDRFWFQLSLHPVRPLWHFPIAWFPTLDALFRQLQQLQLVRDA